MTEKTAANAGALAGIEAEPEVKPAIPQPTPAAAPAPVAGVDMQAIIAQVRAALAAEGNPEVEALKRQIAEKDAELAEMRRQKDAAQMLDRHRSGANESHASSKQR